MVRISAVRTIVAACIVLLLAPLPLHPIIPAFADNPACNWPFTQPTVAANQVDDVVIGMGDGQTTTGKFYVRTAWPGFVPNTAINWSSGSVSDFTGFSPPDNATYQRGHTNTYPRSAVQVSSTSATVGMLLNSLDPGPDFSSQPDVSFNAACWWWDSKPQPFPTNDDGIKVSFDLKVPLAGIVGSSQGAQAAFNLIFRDTVHDLAFWFHVLVFHTNSGMQTFHTIVPDTSGTTNIPIIATSIDVPGWMHKGPNSQGFASSQYSTSRYYEFRVSVTEFLQAVTALKTAGGDFSDFSDLSLTASDYVIEHFNFGAEFHDPSNSSGNGWSQIGLSVANISVGTYKPAHHVYLKGANQSQQTTMRIYFTTVENPNWAEAQGVNVTFPNGGGWTSFSANMSVNPLWYGTVTAMRFDPFAVSGQNFGIDYIRVGDVNANYVQQWEFNDSSNPPTGWTLYQIGNTGAGEYLTNNFGWWGTSTGADPFFYKTGLSFTN